MKKYKMAAYGLLIGLINALFASGGGLIAVPTIRGLGHEQKKAQACALAVILPLSAISVFIYILKGYFSLTDALKYVPFGFIGAFIGTKLLKKASNNILKKAFSLFILWAGIRMIFK